MTTTITLETHDWPVAVVLNDQISFNSAERKRYGWTSETEFVPAHSKRVFHVTSTRSINIQELPKDATDLSALDNLNNVVTTPYGPGSAETTEESE